MFKAIMVVLLLLALPAVADDVETRTKAEQGDADAQFNLGSMYRRNSDGVPPDYKVVEKWYRLAAEQGHAGAQFYMGRLYYLGYGVLQDYKESVKWYRLAAEQGHADAQYYLGWSYNNGQGVIQDNIQAHMWWNISAANGNEYARANRGKVAKEMTPSAIEKAQALAREWMAAH
ncbi:MAG: TPR repeat protein [Candidatus Azotimanducaceae bacterium]|jgi:TPR repeat protein